MLDVGDGRRLERFGRYVVDRPYPAGMTPARDPGAWAAADLRFDRPFGRGGIGRWESRADAAAPAAWPMRHDGLTFELRPTEAGQVGFFPEQSEPWRWLQATLADRREPAATDGPSVLNLFAYTGGSTLACAAAGARVTHVDASRGAVAWARRNAECSGLADARIRWIVDDALAFVGRERRRARRYDGLILDPPSYGHGPGGERWTLAESLPTLLDACLGLLTEPGFVLLTAHSEGVDEQSLGEALGAAFARSGRRADASRVVTAPLVVAAVSGARLEAGVSARWSASR